MQFIRRMCVKHQQRTATRVEPSILGRTSQAEDTSTRQNGTVLVVRHQQKRWTHLPKRLRKHRENGHQRHLALREHMVSSSFYDDRANERNARHGGLTIRYRRSAVCKGTR